MLQFIYPMPAKLLKQREANRYMPEKEETQGRVRDMITRVLKKKADVYTLFSIVDNEKAVDELSKYVGWREYTKNDSFKKWHIRRQKEREDSESIYYLTLDHVRHMYNAALAKFTRERMGKNAHGHWPLVFNTYGVPYHCPEKLANCPTIHVVQGDGTDFNSVLTNLNSDQVYNWLHRKEAPCFYNIAEIDKLREWNILPLCIQKKQKINREILTLALDFLVQACVGDEFADDLDERM